MQLGDELFVERRRQRGVPSSKIVTLVSTRLA